MEANYRYKIRIVGFDEERKRELAEALKAFKAGVGKDWLKKVINEARKGESEIIYQTNNRSDAMLKAHLIVQHGGQPSIEDTMAEEEEEEL